jgi:hypothetical protein
MRKRFFVIIGLMLAVILSMGMFALVCQAGNAAANTGVITAPAAGRAIEPQATNLASISDVVASVRPSVVAINVQVTTGAAAEGGFRPGSSAAMVIS